MTNKHSGKWFLLYTVLAMPALSLFFLTDSISPWHFSIVYWLIGLPFLGYLKVRYDDLLHPAGPLLILTFLYSISPIMVYYSNSGITNYGDAISDKSFLLFCVACIVGEIGIVAGAIIAARHARKASACAVVIPGVMRNIIPMMFLLTVTLAIFSFNNIIPAFDFVHPKAYSETALSSRVAILGAESTYPIMEVFTVGVPVILLIASGIVLTFRKRILLRVVGGGFYQLIYLHTFFLGARGGCLQHCARYLFL